MSFAESDAGMDVERIEHHGVAAAPLRDLPGGGMRERVGAADDERFEGQTRIERGTAERFMRRRDRRCRAAEVAAIAFHLADLARRRRHLRWLRLGYQGS